MLMSTSTSTSFASRNLEKFTTISRIKALITTVQYSSPNLKPAPTPSRSSIALYSMIHIQKGGQELAKATESPAREERQSDATSKEARHNQSKLEDGAQEEQSEATGKDDTREESTTLERLTDEEKQCDLYMTAIHEVNRRRGRWGARRVQRIADDLGIDCDQLKLTWCLLQAIERTRQRPLPVRRGVERSYLQMLHGKGYRDEVSRKRGAKGDIREATEALLAAGEGVMEARSRVQALLKGGETVLRMREDAEYEDDVLLSDEENDITIRGMCVRSIKQLPNAGNIPEEAVMGIAARVATLAERLRAGGKGGMVVDEMGEDFMRMATHRVEAVRWICMTNNYRKTIKRRSDMVEDVNSICEEAGIQLHPVVKEAVVDCFREEAALAEGGLHAFRAVVPEKLVRVVEAREMRRLMGWMKKGDGKVAEMLINRYGSARRSLRAGEDVGSEVLQMLHGADEELHNVFRGHVTSVWLLCRLLKDRFGSLHDARHAPFAAFFDDWGVEMRHDERLGVYRRIHEGSCGADRERFVVSWRVLCQVCVLTSVENCIGLTAALLENVQGGEERLWSVCVEFEVEVCEARRLMAERTNWKMTNTL